MLLFTFKRISWVSSIPGLQSDTVSDLSRSPRARAQGTRAARALWRVDPFLGMKIVDQTIKGASEGIYSSLMSSDLGNT